MDTIFLRLYEDKPFGWLILIALMMLLFLFVRNVYASENLAYNITPVVPKVDVTVNKIEQSLQDKYVKEFDIRIKEKYPNALITDLEKGVKRVKITKYFNSRPVKLNIIETNFKINPNLVVKPSIAGSTLKNKLKIKNFSERENAIVSINGGYFKPETGVPLGLLMIDGRVYTGQIYDRVAMGIFDDGFKMARAKLDIKLKFNKGELIVDNINQPRTLSSHILVYDNLWGKKSPPAPKNGVVMSISNGRILEISTGAINIPSNGFVLSAPKPKIAGIIDCSNFGLVINLLPDWIGVRHVISGGPYLVKNGEVYIDVTAQKLNSITGKNPRTAIGYTKDGNIIIITADGREQSSVGLTLGELARYMKSLGCVNAMNLDGGSSTVMFGAGRVLNSPAVAGGIPVSNAISILQE